MRVVTGARPLPFAGQVGQAHQPSSLLTANSNTVATKRVPYFPHTVDAVIVSVNLSNVLHKGSVTKTAGAQSAGFRLAVPTRGDEAAYTIIFQRRTHELDCETIPVFINETDHLLTLWGEFRREKSRSGFQQFIGVSQLLVFAT